MTRRKGGGGARDKMYRREQGRGGEVVNRDDVDSLVIEKDFS